VTYLLDTMVVSYFLQSNREGELSNAARRLPMAVVDEVRKELEGDRDRGGPAFKRWLGGSGIQVRAIEVGTPASATLVHLLNPTNPDKGRGERASIALAASDDTLTFVTHDKGGMWLALRELWAPGERMLGLAAFLRRLFDLRGIQDPAALDEIISIAMLPAQRPTWWAQWRGGLPSMESRGEGASPPSSRS